MSEKPDIDLHTWISAIFDELQEREAKPPKFFWREGDDAEYCRECFAKLFPTNDWGDEWGRGGDDTEDGPVLCEGCGKLLSYFLTDEGAELELEHFESTEWNWNNPDHCYEVGRMLGNWIGWGAWKVENLPDHNRVIKALLNGENAPANVVLSPNV